MGHRHGKGRKLKKEMGKEVPLVKAPDGGQRQNDPNNMQKNGVVEKSSGDVVDSVTEMDNTQAKTGLPDSEGGDLQEAGETGDTEKASSRKKNRHGKGRKLKKALTKGSLPEDSEMARGEPVPTLSQQAPAEDQVDAKKAIVPPQKLNNIPTAGVVHEDSNVIVVDVEKEISDLKRLISLISIKKAEEVLVQQAESGTSGTSQPPNYASNACDLKKSGMGPDTTAQETGQTGHDAGNEVTDETTKSSSRKKNRHGKGRKLKKELTKPLENSENGQGSQNAAAEHSETSAPINQPIQRLQRVESQGEDRVDGVAEIENPIAIGAIKKKPKRKRKKNKSSQNELPEGEILKYSRSPSEESQILTSAPPTPIDSRRLIAGTFDKFIRGVRASSSSCSFDLISNKLNFADKLDQTEITEVDDSTLLPDTTQEEVECENAADVDINVAFKEEIQRLRSLCQSYFNWLRVPFSWEDAKSFAEILHAKVMDSSNNKIQSEEALKFEGFEKLSDRALLAFMLLIAEDEKAKEAIDDAIKLMQLCREKQLIDFEYLDGFHYVVNCLDIYMQSLELDGKFQDGTISEDDYLRDKLEVWKNNRDFNEDLTPKEKASSLAMKYFFEKELYAQPESQISLCSEIISLDNENPEWYVFLVHNLRLKRREFLHQYPRPTPNFKPEIDTVCSALKLAPNNPNCLLANCLLIADMCFEANRTGKFPVNCGSNTFDSLDEAVKFLRALVSVVLKAGPNHMNYNLTAADIFYKLLPDSHKDTDFAKTCMRQALAINQKSSKANHRMAMFFIIGEKSLVSAEKYCNIAFNEDKRNFPAYCELVQILLSNPTKNAKKLEDLFSFAVKNQSQPSAYEYDSLWSPKKIASVEYMRALFLLMTEKDYIPAVIKMIELEKSQEGICTFRKLGNQIRRYNWSPNCISLNKLCRVLKSALDRTNVEKSRIIPEFQENQQLLRELLQRAQDSQKYDAFKKKKVETEQTKTVYQEPAVAVAQSARFGLAPCTDVRHRK